MRPEQIPSRSSGPVDGLLANLEPSFSLRRRSRRSADVGVERRILGYAASLASVELERTHPDFAGTLSETFTKVVTAVGSVLGGGQPSLRLLQSPISNGVMLGALRSALLSVTESDEDAEVSRGAVRVLRAIDVVERTVAADPSQTLTDTLNGARGLEMVIEVAHDMRSPLTSILFLVETLRTGRSGTLTPVQERQLGLVYGAAFGLSSMASDLLELARGGDRLLDSAPIPFSLVETIQSVRDIVRPIAEEKQLELRTVIPERDARIGYPAAISRVLVNLATNALKYTNQGWVSLGARQLSHTRVAFEVIDTGPGMPQHVQESLFCPFRQIPNSARGPVFSSAGLGLSICRKLVEAMGSRIAVETSPDDGTRFYFELELPTASSL
jgi:signal transduction histidine kinase